MYDFYGNPPKTVSQYKEYLNSWFVKTEEDITVNGRWKYLGGFRRAFCMHRFYQDITTGEFGLHVCEDYFDYDGIFPPNMGVYPSWDDMIHNFSVGYMAEQAARDFGKKTV